MNEDTVKRPLAVVPDSCTLIYASLVEAHGGIDPRSVSNAKLLMDFIGRYGIGVTTQKMVEGTINTPIADELSAEEKFNLSRYALGLAYINFPRFVLESHLPAIGEIYDSARKIFENDVNRNIEGIMERFVSRRKGVLSNRKADKCREKINETLEHPAYRMMMKKLFEEPPNDNDYYLLSLGVCLRERYDNVIIATDDTHMSPMHACPEIGFIVSDAIREKLGVSCFQPSGARRRAFTLLRKAGAIETAEHEKVKSQEEE